MSRVGAKPIDVPSGVSVNAEGRTVSAKGAKGELTMRLAEGISAAVEGGRVQVSRSDDGRRSRSLHGMSRTLVANMLEGVSRGFKRELEIEGVGFRAEVKGRKVFLSLGFAMPKVFEIPDGVAVTEEGGTKLTVLGPDKGKVGDAAAQLRSYFPAEPYKGKGLRYKGERVRRKVGKTVA